ncbi:Cadherin-related family member 2 [Merluccius polli]|uniref:Cadherin-related family member 2 n=1 Tax=Merluccius polli TaxID=89951 RepID=A0AA47MBT6_MERPO|nr:Cadherin-related family member 2 [Merluccius polli]
MCRSLYILIPHHLFQWWTTLIPYQDGGGPIWGGFQTQQGFTYAFITVEDVPDLNPRFLAPPYTASVAEGSPVGTVVLTVTAIDQDTGIQDTIRYRIEESGQPNPFGISETTGAITVESDIDRETISGSITLTVRASESQPNIYGAEAFATTDVQIFITDINDNAPLFYSCGTICVEASQFRGEALENSVGTVQINMTVKDLDQNAQIQVVVEGEDKAAFAVTPSVIHSESKVQLVVKDSQKLDFETKEEMVVQLIAVDMEDTRLRTTATVTITILDTNDNSPTFLHNTYELRVAEHSPVDTVIDTITATDLDQMDQNKLTYRLLPESIHKYFNVTLNTGQVYVTNSTLIDREVGSLYLATLQAIDTKNNIGTTVLEISLTDINDNAPFINRESYMVFVKEGEQATDADDPGTENSKIVFAIEHSKYSNNFTIDPNTGVLKNIGMLDREALDPKMKGKIDLNVTATDRGTPALKTMVKVIIDIEDINDNKPIFKEASYDFSVKEGAKGAFVGFVQAVDLDQAVDFNRISFTIVSGSFGNFIIRTFEYGAGYQGNITVDPDIELDHESLPNQFTLWVEAADLSHSKAEVMVKIKVLDINDERPEFQPVGPVPPVRENSTVTGAVGSFSALDKDGDHALVYHMVSCDCHCNSTYEPCDWMLMDRKGEVTVNPAATIDYEECNRVRIMAQVVDENTEKGENNSVSQAEMLVDIEDINDNVPQFLNSGQIFVLVSESASVSTSVARVTATDRDSQEKILFAVTEVKYEDTNSQIKPIRTIFKCVSAEVDDIFVADIQSIEALDSSTKGKYFVTVSATDKGGLSTSIEIEIVIVDKSFKTRLRFISPLADVLRNREDIIVALVTATKSAVYVHSIKTEEAESRAPGDTIMEAYFVYSNGTAIDSVSVERMVSQSENYIILSKYHLANVATVDVVPEPPNVWRFVLIGLVGGLVIVLIVLSTSLICTRRNYRTKLKAAKAMKSTTMEDNQRGGPVVPGTNKYTMEGANPVLNLNIDTVTDLGFDEEESNVDRISVDSFNDGMSLHSEKDSAMMVIKEEEEEEESFYNEPLSAALAQRANKQNAGSSQMMGFTNPAFSTTDLCFWMAEPSTATSTTAPYTSQVIPFSSQLTSCTGSSLFSSLPSLQLFAAHSSPAVIPLSLASSPVVPSTLPSSTVPFSDDEAPFSCTSATVVMASPFPWSLFTSSIFSSSHVATPIVGKPTGAMGVLGVIGAVAIERYSTCGPMAGDFPQEGGKTKALSPSGGVMGLVAAD